MPNQTTLEDGPTQHREEDGRSGKIFVSYSRKDKETILQHVNFFRANGLDTWIDESGINASSEWAEQIVHAITECDVFILFLSKTSVVSENVRKEIGVAASLGKKILPLKIEDVEIPPSMLYHLNSIHFLETKRVTPEQLMEHVLRAVGKPISKPLVVASEKATGGRPHFILIAALLVAVGMTTFAWVYFKNTPTKAGAPVMAKPLTAAPDDLRSASDTTDERKPSISGATRIAILYFENNSADRPDLQPLTKGLAHMISCEAGNWEGYEVVERDALEKVLKELELSNSQNFDSGSAARIGKLLGAEQLVFGSYMLLFNKFRIDAKVVDVETGKILRSENAKGDPQNFDVLAEELAGRLFSKDQKTKIRGTDAVGLPVTVALQIGEALQKIDEGNREEGLKLLRKLQEEHPESEVLKNTIRLAE
jgi:TolB-like protein